MGENGEKGSFTRFFLFPGLRTLFETYFFRPGFCWAIGLWLVCLVCAGSGVKIPNHEKSDRIFYFMLSILKKINSLFFGEIQPSNFSGEIENMFPWK